MSDCFCIFFMCFLSKARLVGSIRLSVGYEAENSDWSFSEFRLSWQDFREVDWSSLSRIFYLSIIYKKTQRSRRTSRWKRTVRLEIDLADLNASITFRYSISRRDSTYWVSGRHNQTYAQACRFLRVRSDNLSVCVSVTTRLRNAREYSHEHCARCGTRGVYRRLLQLRRVTLVIRMNELSNVATCPK